MKCTLYAPYYSLCGLRLLGRIAKIAVNASESIRFISELLFVFVRYFVTHKGRPEYLLFLYLTRISSFTEMVITLAYSIMYLACIQNLRKN